MMTVFRLTTVFAVVFCPDFVSDAKAEAKLYVNYADLHAKQMVCCDQDGPVCPGWLEPEPVADSGDSSRKFLVFTNAGDHSVVTSWVACPGRQFDLFINFYGDDESEEETLRSVADKFRVGKGFKYNCFAYWLEEEPHLLDQYDAVAVLDDDMGKASSGKINALFQILVDEDLYWMSPTFTGKQWNKISPPQPNSYLRYQTWFDMTFVWWRKDKLVGYLKQHDDRVRGWHEDVWGWNYLGAADLNAGVHKRSACVDAIVVDNPPTRSNGKREAEKIVNGLSHVDCIAKTIEAQKAIAGFQNVEDTKELEVRPIVPLDRMPTHIKEEATRCPGDVLQAKIKI